MLYPQGGLFILCFLSLDWSTNNVLNHSNLMLKWAMKSNALEKPFVHFELFNYNFNILYSLQSKVIT